jgi:hypothetical protein
MAEEINPDTSGLKPLSKEMIKLAEGIYAKHEDDPVRLYVWASELKHRALTGEVTDQKEMFENNSYDPWVDLEMQAQLAMVLMGMCSSRHPEFKEDYLKQRAVYKSKRNERRLKPLPGEKPTEPRGEENDVM